MWDIVLNTEIKIQNYFFPDKYISTYITLEKRCVYIVPKPMVPALSCHILIKNSCKLVLMSKATDDVSTFQGDIKGYPK